MDFKIFLTTFTAMLIAELADKTQLMGITLAGKSGRPFSVWLGSVTAFMIVTAVSVTLGAYISRYLPPQAVRIGGGTVFVVIGLLMVSGRFG